MMIIKSKKRADKYYCGMVKKGIYPDYKHIYDDVCREINNEK